MRRWVRDAGNTERQELRQVPPSPCPNDAGREQHYLEQDVLRGVLSEGPWNPLQPMLLALSKERAEFTGSRRQGGEGDSGALNGFPHNE